MIPQSEKQRDGMSDLPQIPPLSKELALRPGVEATEFVNHGGVAQIHKEIGMICQHVCQSLLIYAHIGAHVEMRIGLNCEGESSSSRPLRVKIADGVAHRLTAREPV